MARVKITEHCAKTLLVDSYSGMVIRHFSIDKDISRLEEGQKYIIKVDQGIKKRGKQGLIRADISKEFAKSAAEELIDKGFNRLLAEPMLYHDETEEKYLSIERMRDGFKVLYSEKGGVGVEEDPTSIQHYDDVKDVPLPQDFLSRVVKIMNQQHLCFVEINPLIVRGQDCILLDAAVMADSAGEYLSSWDNGDVVDMHVPSTAETDVARLNSNSPASFSFRVLNPNGAIWFLLSGGGASITIADEAANRKKADLIGNYGEYSGGPTREETQLYTEAVLGQVFQSAAPKKAIVIAGGVANFTDVKKTFAGVIDALSLRLKELKDQKIEIFVRRGGPNEKEGLELMKKFLKSNGIYGSVHGSDKVLTVVVDEALEYVDV